ncbi:MAG: HD domain-containing protein [Patescibacteria group bacterium]
MTVEQIQKQILTSDEFVLEEVAKLQYLYGLKNEIRWDSSRTEEVNTESVGEHIYGMIVIANYFLLLENPQGDWDIKRIYDMIAWHDIDEIETGDTLGWKKTQKVRDEEINAMKRVIANAPHHLQNSMVTAIEEYEAQVTPESRFTRAIDKIESTIEIFNENGKFVLLRNQTKLEHHRACKDKYFVDFPIIHHVNEVITQQMIKNGYFFD